MSSAAISPNTPQAPAPDDARATLAALKGAGGARGAKNGLATAFVWACAAIAVVPLVWVLWSVISQGAPVFFGPTWWTQDMANVLYRREGGGVLGALVGSVMISAITSLVSLPLAILGAIFLIEYSRGTRVAKLLSFMVDILGGVPSIVAALFVYALGITLLGFNRSGVAAALALALLMIPVVLRSTEEMLKLVPDSLREASFALGVPKWKTILRVVVPTAFSGILTGSILGLARVMGETAPLLVLIGWSQYLTFDPTASTIGTLPTFINEGRMNPEESPGYARAWGAAMTLIVVVMALNLLARAVSSFGKIKEK